MISEACAAQEDSSDASQGGKSASCFNLRTSNVGLMARLGTSGQEISLAAGSPLVLTHKIKLLPLAPGSSLGACGCEVNVAALRERVERLEREVSALRETCGGSCTSVESKGKVSGRLPLCGDVEPKRDLVHLLHSQSTDDRQK